MKKVAILLTDQFADWEFGLLAGTGKAFYGLDVQFFAPRKGSIISQGGLNVSIDQDLGDLQPWKPDAIAIIGGMIWESNDAPDISNLLQSAHTENIVLAGICGGTLALASAGLLNDRPHTSNHLDFLKKNVDTYTGDKHFVESAQAICSDNIITSAGTATTSFTAHIFEKLGIETETIAQFKAMMTAEHK